MNKNLVLVESPAKAKTINKYLGRGYMVEATVGHIRNLPKTKLGIDLDNDYTPSFQNIRGKGDIINKIRKLASKSDQIFIATDPDREGEAIAQDIVDTVKGKTEAKIFRVLFNEITKASVKKAMKEPIEINENLVSSQRARRVMDRIIGYKISPILWQAVLEASGSSLSAGRVQSVALRLICEREEAIEAFITTEYWSIYADFLTEDKEVIRAKLAEIDGKSIKTLPKPEMTSADWDEFLKKNFALNNEKITSEIIDKLSKIGKFEISNINKKEVRRNPYPPFITSSLQAEASKKLRFRPRKTMQVAQSLYEGVDLGKEGFAGLITYMRTDSTRVNLETVNDARSFIDSQFGKEYSPSKPRLFENKSKKNVQDAHEAIRPTSISYSPEFVKEFLNKDQFQLYDLIWKRFIASQMEAAVLLQTTVSISGNEFLFKSTGTIIKFDGFLKMYEESRDENNGNNEDDSNSIFPAGIKDGQLLKTDKFEKFQHFTKPLPRFTESTLIKELESNGIGRPSTYASILSTIQDRQYVDQFERKIKPTDLGKRVNGVLIKYFPKILNVNFTAKMENELDLISTGEDKYKQVLDDFYIPFSKALEEVQKNIEKVKCDKCGSDMEIKIGRFGKFLACSNYPDCKNIKSLKEMGNQNKEVEYTGENCPKCQSRTIYRRGKFGKFIGCEKYPDCDFTQQITLGIPCPKCSIGEVVARRSKKGRYFYGCSKYPDCDFTSWKKPGAEEEE